MTAASGRTPRWEIRPAAETQWALTLGLLPELLQAEHLPEVLLVAHPAGAPDHPVGAAALLPLARDTRRSGFRGSVHVLPAFRRRGLGRTLVAALGDEARRWDVSHLHSWGAYPAGPESAFLASAGFAPLREIHYFRGDPRRTFELCSGFVERTKKHRRLQPGLHTRALTEADIPSAADLYAAHFGLSPQNARAHLAAALARPPVAALSVALVDADDFAGFLLASATEDGVGVDLWVVAPDYRNGTAAMRLLGEAGRLAAAAGHAHADFHCHDESRATLRIARLIGATALEVRRTWALDL